MDNPMLAAILNEEEEPEQTEALDMLDGLENDDLPEHLQSDAGETHDEEDN